MTKKGLSHYLSSPAPTEIPKYPLGKIAGLDAHTYDGSSIMHVVRKNDEDKWVLLCRPKKKAVYHYRGYAQVIKCLRCTRLRDKPIAQDPPQEQSA